MPIYAYKCASCGYAKDALQKISDAPLTVCPQCGKPALQKQVTAAGFQLKGTGWYVTDFRGGASSGPNSSSSEEGVAGSKPDHAKDGQTGSEAKTGAKSETKSEAKPESKSASSGGSDAPAAPASSTPTPSASGN